MHQGVVNPKQPPYLVFVSLCLTTTLPARLLTTLPPFRLSNLYLTPPPHHDQFSYFEESEKWLPVIGSRLVHVNVLGDRFAVSQGRHESITKLGEAQTLRSVEWWYTAFFRRLMFAP